MTPSEQSDSCRVAQQGNIGLHDRLTVRVDCRWREEVALSRKLIEGLRFHLETEAVNFFDQAAGGIYHSGLDEIAVSSEEIPILKRRS